MKKSSALLLAAALVFSSCLIVYGAGSRIFSDVDPKNHWAAGDIEFAYNMGVIEGTSYDPNTGERRFAPDRTLSYAAFSTIMLRAAYPDKLRAAEQSYSDWVMAAGSAAGKAGILDKGMSREQLSAAIPRYEMAKLLVKLLNSFGEADPSLFDIEGIISRIPDGRSIPDAYRDHVAVCYDLGLINGGSDGSFNGSRSMTRAQAAAVYNRYEQLQRRISNGENIVKTPSLAAQKKAQKLNVINALLANSAIIKAERVEAPEDYKAYCALYNIRYRSDNCEVVGMLALPLWYADSCETQKLDPLPGMVYCRGGNRDFGMLEPWEVCWYAYHGYAVFGSQYRGNAGGTGREDFGGNDVHDVTNLMEIAVHMPFVKGDRVYLWGVSRGGMMAYRAIQEKPGRIRAAVINSGLADCYVSYNRDKSMAQVYIDLVGGGPDKYPKEFDRRSATKFAADLNVPMFIGQGTDDWRVIPLQVENLEKALKAAGKKAGTDYTIKWYQGGTHCLYETSFESDAMNWLSNYPIN